MGDDDDAIADSDASEARQRRLEYAEYAKPAIDLPGREGGGHVLFTPRPGMNLAWGGGTQTILTHRISA